MRDMQLQDWALTIDELYFLAKQREDIRFELAVGIRCLRVTGFYPKSYRAIDPETLEYVSRQIFRPPSDLLSIEWTDRRARRRRETVCAFLGLRRATTADLANLAEWLQQQFRSEWPSEKHSVELSGHWFAARSVMAPADAELDRFVRAERRAFEDTYLNRVYGTLDPTTCRILEDSLTFPDRSTGFASLKAAPGKAAMAAFRDFAER